MITIYWDGKKDGKVWIKRLHKFPALCEVWEAKQFLHPDKNYKPEVFPKIPKGIDMKEVIMHNPLKDMPNDIEFTLNFKYKDNNEKKKDNN